MQVHPRWAEAWSAQHNSPSPTLWIEQRPWQHDLLSKLLNRVVRSVRLFSCYIRSICIFQHGKRYCRSIVRDEKWSRFDRSDCCGVPSERDPFATYRSLRPRSLNEHMLCSSMVLVLYRYKATDSLVRTPNGFSKPCRQPASKLTIGRTEKKKLSRTVHLASRMIVPLLAIDYHACMH